ncbi:MAG TPA: Calx-beta domain-containing protein [Candidatus Sulfotelmatobacter sp.]|nr:Calx-beta domain-containing protein [Candidatus Sulfotelmatobacter sp.]
MKIFWGQGVQNLLSRAYPNHTAPERASFVGRSRKQTTAATAILAAFACFLAVSAIAQQPANDNFANAFVITGAAGTTNGSNIGATLQAGETNQVLIDNPNDPYNYNKLVPVTNSVWFEWTAATNGVATFDTLDSTDEFGNVMGTVLAVWTGSSVSNLTLVASCAQTFDDFNLLSSNLASTVSFPALAGTNYYISVDLDAALGAQPGNYMLNWDAVEPANDDVINAANLGDSLSGSTNGINVDATMETNEITSISTPDNGPVTVGNSIWYYWTAPDSGNVTFSTLGSTDEIGNPEDTVLAAWTPNVPAFLFNSVTNLTFLGYADDNINNTNLNSSLTFFASGGQTYYISVYVNDSKGGLPGNVALSWNQTASTPGSGTGPLASGTFQFTSLQYQFSQDESEGADHAAMTETPARATITRIGGADGMTDVGYYFTNTLYTNWTDTVTYQTNTFAEFWNTNLTMLLYTTNGVTTVVNHTTVYQDYNTSQGFFNVTNLSSSLFEQAYSNGMLISTNYTSLPYVTNLGVLNGPITVFTNTIINTNTGIGIITNGFYITNELGLATVTNTSIPAFIYTTNFFTYTNLYVTNIISTYLGYGFPVRPQTNVFNDFQMNSDISITAPYGHTLNEANPLALVILTGATLDPYEDPDLTAPQISSTRNVAYVSFENDFGSLYPDPAVFGANADGTNVFNFERSTLRCDKTVAFGGNAYVGVTWNNYDPNKTANVYYRIDYVLPGGNDSYNYFATQAGSDYARPDDAGDGIFSAAPDFFGSQVPPSGQIVWNGNGAVQYIKIPITQDSTVKFNKDIRIDLYYPPSVTPTTMNGFIGEINTCTLTILMTTPPAGAVDTSYMAENNPDPGGNDANQSDPGTSSGQVNAVVVQTNGYAVIAGQFNTFTANPSPGPQNNIARLDLNGNLDGSFAVGSGPTAGFTGGFVGGSAAVNALAQDSNNNIIAVGTFTEFAGNPAGGIARLLPTGAPDPSFDNAGSGANSNVWAVAVQPNGQILIGGDFTYYNGTNVNRIARLNPDGSLDTTFNPGLGPNGTVDAIAVQPNGAILIGGTFSSVDNSGPSAGYNNIARLNPDGSLDGTFDNLNGGAEDTVEAITLQTNGLILVGGWFTSMDDNPNFNYLARLNPDGSLDTNFFSGTGPDNAVYAINLQNDGTFYIGGYFQNYNQTRRVGIARILPNGWLDTTFMDTAYNQFAGVVNNYYWDLPNSVNAIAVEPVTPPDDQSETNDIIIGGSFSQVGGDGGLPSPNYTLTFNREAPPHPRSNVARLIGGSTPGPGNISFLGTYGGDNTSPNTFIPLSRVNGQLGTAAVTFQPVQGTGAGAAQQGVDYTFNAVQYSTPTWGVSYGNGPTYTWMLEDGYIGTNQFESAINGRNLANPIPYIDVISNNTVSEVTLNLQLVSPKDQDTFFLGGSAEAQAGGGGFGNPATEDGENIPLGVALGQESALMTITHASGSSGVFSFSSNIYYTNEDAGYALLTVTRTGGSSQQVNLDYKTTGGDAVPGRDYVSTNGTLRFKDGSDASQTIAVPIINYYTNQSDRVFQVQIYTPSAGTLGPITNAEVEIVNDNIANGFIDFVNGTPVTNVMQYGVNENAGVAQVSVARLGGSQGNLQITLSTQNGTASSGVNYAAFTTNLVWASGSPNVVQTVYIPVYDTGSQGSNLTFKVSLTNAILGTAAYTNYGAFTNALITITNTDLPGTAEFTSSSYNVNENGGDAIIPIVRTGGSAGNLSVQFYTMNGSAQNGTNYQGTTNTVVFAAGQVATNITIGLSNLNSPTALTFLVGLTDATPTNALGSPNLAEVTINGADSVNEPPGNPDTTYNPALNGTVLTLALQTNGQLLAGGDFTAAGQVTGGQFSGVPRYYIARFNSDGSLDSTFSSYLPGSGASSPVQVIALETNGYILVGGQFTNFDGQTAGYMTRIDANGSIDGAFAPGNGANNPVYALAQTFVGGQSRILVGGAFTSFNEVPSASIVQLLDGGGVDPNFNANANATVYAIAVQPNGQILIGGDFTNVDGVTVDHIARLNADGSLDYGFTNAISNPSAGANGSVRVITLQMDGRILIGGNFTSVDGVPCNYIARLNSDGSLDSSFINASANSALGANGPVSTIAVQSDSRIVVGGQFTQFNGVTRNSITRLNADGTTDLTINFGTGADGSIYAAVIQTDGNIDLGGAFQHYNSILHPYLVRIYGRSTVGSGSFGFTVASEQAPEDQPFAQVTVLRYGGTAGPNADGSGNVYVNLLTLTNSGTAVPGVNYTPVSATLTFPPGEVEVTTNIPILNDAVQSPAQWTVPIVLTNPVPASLQINNEQNTNTLIIINTSSFISFASTAYSVADNVQPPYAFINLIRTGYPSNAVSVEFTTTGGTAAPDIQYMPVGPTNIVFNPGVTNIEEPVPVMYTTTYFGSQTVTMTLSNASSAYLIAPTNATLTIDDVLNVPGQICFSSSNYTADVSSGQAVLTVLYTNGNNAVSVNYMTVSGTAQAPYNYTPISGTLNFGNGTNALPIVVQLPPNNTPEGPLNFSVVLTNAADGATLISPSNATVTILDDVSTGVSFVNATNYYEETNGIISVLVQRVGNPNTAFSVPFATTPGTATTNNYVPASGTLKFGTNETESAINITLYNNENVSNLTFGISLYPTNGVQLLSPSNTLVEITPAAAGLTFVTPTNSVVKGTNFVLLPVICINPSNEPPILNSNSIPLSVNFATMDGTGISNIDYVATNGVLVFTNGMVTNTISVQILNNNLISGQRTFSVYLFNPQPTTNTANVAKLVQPTNEVITVIDDNSGLAFSSPNYSIDNGGNATITVVRVDNTNATSTVQYATVPGGSAIANSDYVPTNGSLTFQPGQTSTNFQVTVIGSSSVEPDKTILMALSNPTNSSGAGPAILTAPSAATLTIYNQNGSYIVPAGVSLANSSGAPNGILQSNQQVQLWFGFRDAGGLDVSNMTATLIQSANITPSPIPETESYGNMTVNGHSRSQEFTLTPIGTNGQTIAANFQLKVTSVGSTTPTTETNSFALTIGTTSETFSNTNAIVIFGESPGGGPVIASPYPSIITVSNAGGVLVGVTATLTNFSDTSPQAVSVLLVSPAEQDVLLMSGVGTKQVAASGVTLTFSNSATFFNPLPETNDTALPITNGVYTPTQYGTTPTFP